MEEIYTLIQERIENMEEVKRRYAKLDNTSSVSGFDIETSYLESPDFLQHVSQIKRIEKLRIIKENELMEVIFSLRSFDGKQKLRFQSKSYEIMKQVKHDFNYEKYKNSGETKDVAKLYLNFFIFLKMDGKVNDLKRAYANNKFMGYPIISALMKWLIEITRESFQNILKEKVKELPSILANKSKKASLISSGQKLAQCVNVRPQSMAKSRGNPPVRTMADQPRKNEGDTPEQDKNLLAMNNPSWSEFSRHSNSPRNLDKSILALSGKTLKGNQNAPRYARSQTNPRETPTTFEVNSPMEQSQFQVNYQTNNSTINLNTSSKDGKIIKRGLEGAKQSNIIHFSSQVLNQNNNNPYLDVLEDVDILQAANLIPQLFTLNKTSKRNRDPHIVTIDLDKKRELICHLYKNMYNRNWEVERTIMNFQNRLWQDSKISYEPVNKQRRGENFCENYNINFGKRFPHVLRVMPNIQMPVNLSKNSTNTKIISKRESSAFLSSLTQANQNQETNNTDFSPPPYNPSPSPKNGRSSSLRIERIKQDTESTITPKEKEKDREIEGNQFQTQNEHLTWDQELSHHHLQGSNSQLLGENHVKMTDIEEAYNKNNKGNSGLGFGYRSENHFRIVSKKVSLFQDGKPGEDKTTKSVIAKPYKIDYPLGWTSSEEITKGDEFSDRMNVFQTITSRRDLNQSAAKAQSGSSRTKGAKLSHFNQEKARSWSTEKARLNNQSEDIQTRITGQFKRSSEQREDKMDLETEVLQIKTLQKPQQTITNNVEGEELKSSNLSSDDKVYGDHLLRDNSSADLVESVGGEYKKSKQGYNQKPLSAIPRLYPRHVKHYGDVNYVSQKG